MSYEENSPLGKSMSNKQMGLESAADHVVSLMKPQQRSLYLCRKLAEGRKVPNVPKKPSVKKKTKDAIREAELQWWFEKLTTGKILINDDSWKNVVPIEDLASDYASKCSRYGVTERGYRTSLGKLLKHIYPLLHKAQRAHETSTGRRRIYLYCFPDLEEARRLWGEKFGHGDWP